MQSLLAGTAGCRIVDSRFDLKLPTKGRQDYLAGHIPNAVFADLDRDLAGPVTSLSGRHPLPDVGVFSDKIAAWGIAADTQVVVYDSASGALASRLWWLLRWLGHEHVAVLDGGLKAWLEAGGKLECHEPEFARAIFVARPDPTRIVTTEEISAAIKAGEELNLFDARDAPRFRGDSEPIDPVAGHVPGAVNLPMTSNLDADGRWRPANELRELWQEVLKSARPDLPVTTMCGSGVTACHLVLSAQIAGLPEPRVYVGSWSEWIRDPGRPVATGVRP
jgi:thiosulfate/3-mercaptopyruvate sulfurtransferase